MLCTPMFFIKLLQVHQSMISRTLQKLLHSSGWCGVSHHAQKVQNVLRSQAHKSKTDPTHESENKEEGLDLKMQEEGWACKKKKITLGP